jgi:hypothetical protein
VDRGSDAMTPSSGVRPSELGLSRHDTFDLGQALKGSFSCFFDHRVPTSCLIPVRHRVLWKEIKAEAHETTSIRRQVSSVARHRGRFERVDRRSNLPTAPRPMIDGPLSRYCEGRLVMRLGIKLFNVLQKVRIRAGRVPLLIGTAYGSDIDFFSPDESEISDGGGEPQVQRRTAARNVGKELKESDFEKRGGCAGPRPNRKSGTAECCR